jgi:hypothetical protein
VNNKVYTYIYKMNAVGITGARIRNTYIAYLGHNVNNKVYTYICKMNAVQITGAIIRNTYIAAGEEYHLRTAPYKTV